MKIILNRFDGSISTDNREPSGNNFTITRNFSTLDSSYTLKPFKGVTADQVKAYFLTDFLYIPTNVFAYGVQSGQGSSGKMELYNKTPDILSGTWTTTLTTTGQAVLTRGVVSNLFFLYKNYIYFASGGTKMSRIGDIVVSGSSATFTENWQAVAYTNGVTQAMVHPKDDIMYWGVDNVVVKNNAGSYSSALTLPTTQVITSLAPYGNYLAIACKPISGIGNSTVYLWDRDSSLTTLSESIDWGQGNLNVLENIDGTLIGVSVIGNTNLDYSSRLVVKAYNGATPTILCNLVTDVQVCTLSTKKWKANNNLYFSAKITIDGVSRNGIWLVGKNQNRTFTVTGDILVNNDTEPTTVDGFAKFNDIWFIAYNQDGSVNRTVSDSSYSGTAIWESLINPGMPASGRYRHKTSFKKLYAVEVSYLPLTASYTPSVTLQYRVDGGSYTDIFTDSTTGSFNRIATIDSAGSAFTDGYEYQFKLKCTGGAVVTAITYRYDILETNIELT